ncbi:iron chelate uptake ABC transporter family permease subunit [Bacillus altitudinis]|uniref:iron chelate uptake ABC transporter family permease subunit n=1 Tax=Bacillus altitudinis TaxID=293387 RepID=UPI0022820A66|nr:iron chelate uptake ABC transporter family permease subunit [Bacillus altitudinis]MCY7688660.1 iron chelate uptake ABC transporter family permease subunit [Bacillus altitudinis]MCY7703383.1 iron chelate uptake ABC transporter family permease subunit [Bacillus altitudinis]
MHKKRTLFLIAAIAAVFVVIFVTFQMGYWEYTVPSRLKKVLAMTLTGGAIAFSSVVFQTLTNNRILTPSILGLDALYLFLQTAIIYLFGSTNMMIANKNLNFFLCVGLMILFSVLLYTVMFKRKNKHIFLLLLVGIVFGTLFKSLSSFMEMLIDPNEYQVVQDKSFASFNHMNTDILLLASLLFAALCLYIWTFRAKLDVMSLGKEQAVNLGIDYDGITKKMLIVIAVLVSIATALVGPITFLGLLVVNVARELFRTYQHTYLLLGSFFISVIALVGGEFLVEKVFTFQTPLSVLIDLVGGLYFIYLLLKESRSWS